MTAKDPQLKERYHKEYKDYRNMLSTIFKQSKTNYYNHYFEANWNSIKNTWKCISILYIKNISAETCFPPRFFPPLNLSQKLCLPHFASPY